ncbi:MAG: FAD-dependent oxidoreductase [Clostridia bacterium]|nr:FAD-dependent oxidoreductase [Clostridia bacterium]
MKKYDVIVVGGGFAGVGAALAAAKQKQNVLLIEQSGALGGAANNALVMPYMPYYTNVLKEDGTVERKFLSRGIFEEINQELAKIEKLNVIKDFANFDAEHLKIVLDRFMKKYEVDVLFHTTVCDVIKQDKRITAVEVITVSGKMVFEADSFVDSTGDGNLAAFAGCEFQLGRLKDNLCQPMTLCFRVSNVSYEDFTAEKQEILKLYKQYKEEGKIKNPRENVLVFKSMIDNVLHFNSTRIVKMNPIDPFDLSKAEIEAREQMLELFTFLKNNFASFKNAQLAYSAPSIGVRESRKIVGEYVLTVDDLLSLKKFDDAIAAGNYDIDIHNPEGTGTHHHYFPAGVYYTIPYGSLVAKDVENLLIAGRCISCTHEAQASIRIMPICCTTGEAAGVAAALVSKNKIEAKNVDIGELQGILKENNVFF